MAKRPAEELDTKTLRNNIHIVVIARDFHKHSQWLENTVGPIAVSKTIEELLRSILASTRQARNDFDGG